MKTKTSIHQLSIPLCTIVEKLAKNGYNSTEEFEIEWRFAFESALIIHKQEIIDAYAKNRCINDKTMACSIKAYKDAEDYYKDKFVTQ